MSLTRRAFGRALTGSTVLLSIHGCGGSDDEALDTVTPGCGVGGAAISLNHGHVLTIAASDLDSPIDMAYGIRGAADHDHSVTLTVATLRQLKAGQSVMAMASVVAAHAHGVTITCAI